MRRVRMNKDCGGCSFRSQSDCDHLNYDAQKKNIDLNHKEKNKRKYSIEYRISRDKLGCTADELLDRIKAYTGLVDELEFTEKEIIISYDDRLITPKEISDLVE